ncbi:AKAP9 protein, partial [Polypterus senegalus]
QLAEYRQKKAQADGQKRLKKKKKVPGCTEEGHIQDCPDHVHSQSGETSQQSTAKGASTDAADFSISRTLRSGDTIKHDQIYTIEPESELSTTADDYSSEEEDIVICENHSKHEAQTSQTRLEMMEEELAGKQQAIEELSRELEEMRTAYGTEGLQQLQDFETAVKQRDEIITQLTANLQLAHKERDEIMKEFLELTEQSQKLQIQFQQLQVGENLRNTSHTTTAADLVQAKQQILAYQLQIEEQQLQIRNSLVKVDEYQLQIQQFKEQIIKMEKVACEHEGNVTQSIKEKEELIEQHSIVIKEHQNTIAELNEKLSASDMLLEDLGMQLQSKFQDLESLTTDLNNSRQREKQSSDEIKQLMGTVEELQKRYHKESQSEKEIIQRINIDTQRKMEQLRAELDEMYGQQIVKIKQELNIQHRNEIDNLITKHRLELDLLISSGNASNQDQINTLTMTINELKEKLQETKQQKDHVKQELSEELAKVTDERTHLQRKVENLLQDLTSAKEELAKSSQSFLEQENKINEIEKLKAAVDDLNESLVAAAETSKEMKCNYETEITTYKIKLEMLEREKDAVLDRMAESQEAELDKVRTQLLFSHEEELTKLKEDLKQESELSIENLKNELELKYKQNLEMMQTTLNEQLDELKAERDCLSLEKENLLGEISKMNEKLCQQMENCKIEEMALKVMQLQAEIEELRKEEKEKGTLDQEIQELQAKNDVLQKQMKEKEDVMSRQISELTTENYLLKQSKEALEEKVQSINLTGDLREHSFALSAQPQLQTLISENEDLKKYIAQLEEEIQTQKNTFSFAEKNFEVNYQELKDEYTCLLKVKANLEDQMVKETAKYQSDLKNLQMQIQDLQSSKVVDLPGSTLPESKELKRPEVMDGEIIEKDATELMEKLVAIQREKHELTSRLAETYEELNVKQNEINQLHIKLEALKAENEQTFAKCLELEQIQSKLQGGSFHNQNMEYMQSSIVTVSEAAESDMCTVKDHFQQISLLEEKVSMLQGSLENAYVEIKKLHEEQVVLSEDKESLLGELHVLKEKPNAETLALIAEPDREQLQQLVDSLRTEQLGLAKLVQQKTLVEESLQKKLHEKDKELVKLNEKILILQEQLNKLHQEGGEIELLEEDKKVKQADFKLQMEAQHISLTQIYAAQLDLLRESLESEKECCLRRLEEDLTICHRQEIKILKENYNKELNILKKQKSGLKYQEVFQDKEDKEDAKLKKAVNVFSMRSKESSDPHDVLNEVKDLHEDLQSLREQILWDYNCLEELHTSLRTDLSKLDELQIAYDHLKCKNEEVSNVEAQKECLHDTKEGLDIQSAHLESTEQLKSNFSQQRARIEDQHNQEMKLLQEYYQQQIKETDERYVTEIMAHQKRVHSSEDKFSGSQIVLPKASSVEQQYAEEIKVIVQLSIEFAQQNELDRITFQERKTTSEVQTLSEELEGEALNKGPNETCPLANLSVVKEFEDEQLEDLRQELVRQDQEHQLIVEDLKHAHMQQLERQKEEQEKLLTELKMLRSQLVKNEETHSGSQEEETQSKPAEAHDRTCEEPASDLVSFERNLLQKTNERLRQVLSDVLKTTAAMEETIGRHVEVLLEQSGKAALHSTSEEPDKLCCTSIHATKPENYSEPSHASRTGEDDAHIWSGDSGKSLEVSQEITAMNFPAEELDLENEVFMMSISTRLQAAVGKLLEAITETTTKLEHARITQTELMRESFRHNAEINELQQRQEELQELLCEETKEKEQLALELHKAEGIIDGYLDERTALEKQVQMKTELISHLEQELHSTNSRLQELDEERQSIQQQRELLSRQQDAMKNSAGSRELRLVDAAVDAAPEADLLEETEKLMKEKVEVQLQAEKEHSDLLKQVKTLELELEEQINKVGELEQDKTVEVSDLRQQIQALEKQLEKNRKFLDQQAIDREHERDVFQQEIHKLEEQLKTPQKLQPCSEQNHTEIEILKKQLHHKTDQCSELLLQMDQFQRDIQERDEEIDKMSNRIRELENMEVRKQLATSEVMLDSVLEAQLQTERDALDRKEKENEIASLQQSQHESENVSIDDHKLVIGKLSQVIHEKEHEVESLNEQIEKLQQQLEFSRDKKVIDKKNEQIKELESQVEFQRSDLERLKIKSEDEIEQLNEVIEKLQLELAHIENKSQDVYNSEEAQHIDKSLVKMLKEEDSDRQREKGSEEVNLPKEEFEAMKQNIYLTNQELEFLKGDRMKLLDKISHLEHSLAINEDSAHKVKLLEEVLQEKTATLLVIQAELNAVEESANSHITNLEDKLEELEFAVQKKDTEFNQYYIRAKDIENDNVVLQQKVLELEERLNQGTQSPSLNQASHSTLKKQSNINTKELYDNQGKNEEVIPEIVSIETEAVAENILVVDGDSQKDEETQNSIVEESETKLNRLIVKLADLEEELTELNENQELQRQLLYSTEKDKAEYEKKLAKLTVLLELMRKPAVEKENLQRVLGSVKVPDSDKSDEENSSMFSIRLELEAVKSQAAATEEDLNYHRKQAEDLKGYLKVTEMNKGTTYDLQTELEEVKSEAVATKEELNSCREHAEKLKDEIQVREITIKQLQEERQQLKNSLAEAQKQLDSEILKSVGTSLDEKQKPENESNLTFFKDKSSLPRINASSQTDEAVTFGDNSVLEHAILKDAEVQIDFKDQNDSSEEIAEMIRSYTEKIGQMQELHAAEIMDMETRHICESESLKRDSHFLREECKALNNMVAKMNSTEAVFASGFQSSSEYKDEYASDSGSDLSQRLYLTSEPERQEYRTIPEEQWRENEVFSSEVLPERIKNLLREVHQEGMQILSLSEASYPEEKPLSSDLFSETWQKERQALIDTVESLKILITKMQVHRKEEPSLDFASAEDHTDWRGDLLQAVQQIFQKEHGILKHTLVSLAHSLETSDSMMYLNQLVHTINEQLCFLFQLDGQSQQSTPEIQQIFIKPESREAMESIQELQELLQSERTLVAKLKTEIAQTKVELETTLKVQHKHLKEMEILRQEITEKSAEIDVLNDVLASVQKKSGELHRVSEIERCKSEQNQDRERGEMEDLEFPLEDQAYQNRQLGSSVEHEDQAVSLLKKQIEMEKSLHESQLSHEKNRISELQVLLESERARAMELSNRLEQQKSLWSQLEQQTSQQATAERAVEGQNIQEAPSVRPMEQLLVDLEDQLDEKHNRIVELVGDMEKYKLEIVQIKQQLDEEKQIHQADILKEKDACKILQEEVKQLRYHKKEVEEQLDKLKQQVFVLQQERYGLQDKIKQIQDKKGPEDYQDKAEILEQLGGEKSQWEGDRTREWINQQKLPEVLARDSSAPSLDEVNEEVPSPLNSKYLDNIFQRLHLFSSKLKTLANKASSKLNFETTDEEEFLWLQNSIQDVVSQLQQLTMIPPAEISGVVHNRSASGSLTERLLRQNAELTGFVSRLTEEKNDLRNSVIRLEEELRRYRQCSFGGYDYSNRKVLDNWDTLDVIHTDRETWAREKCNLEKSLRQAEAEVSKLRAELRNDALCREVAGSDGESAMLKVNFGFLKRLYGKYLRAESFRKALIYQKKYLLLLLGGFQECEKATLSLIARMGGHPSHTSLDIITHHCRAFIRFRSIVRVSIAVSRMKFLVRRWQRVTESGSISNSSINRNGYGHLPGSLETYGERRHTSRARSGMESPRSALSVQNRYQSGPADSNSGPLPCSHLQNYDPDRALTDYIHRLEALQRRLGSVPSGNVSNAMKLFHVSMLIGNILNVYAFKG